MFDLTAETGLFALFVASFLAATVLPGGSEVVLIGVLHANPDAFWKALAVATCGNTLGAVTSYWLGRLLPNRVQQTTLAALHRHGYWALLFTWLPVVGDALAVGAGWLRLDPWISTAAFAIGKFARYLAIAGVWEWFATGFLS